MTIKSATIPITSITHAATTGQGPSDHHGGSVTVGGSIPVWNGTLGELVQVASNAPTIDGNGEAAWPGQPAVLYINSATDANVTGNGTVATIDFNTQIADRGADFAADTFTAPSDGLYAVHWAVALSGMDTLASPLLLKIVTSNRDYEFPWLGITPGGAYTREGSAIVDMDAGDTLTITAAVSGEGSDIVDILGNPTNAVTFLSIWKLG